MRHTSELLIIVLAACTCTGCSVLSEKHTKAIRAFSKSVDTYDTLPGAMIQQHGEILAGLAVSQAIPEKDAGTSWERVVEAAERQSDYAELARRSDAALKVLESYAKMLELLSADDYTASLDASAQAFGSSLDSATELYSSLSGSPIDSIGGIAAAAVRGTAGLYIRRKQYTALREFTKNGDAIVETMTNTIVEMCDIINAEYSDGGTEDDLKLFYEAAHGTTNRIDNKEQAVRLDDGITKVLRSQSRSAHLSERAFRALLAVQSLPELAQRTREAAVKLREAHKTLVKAFDSRNDKIDLDSLIDQVNAAKQEIEAAAKLLQTE